MPFLARRFAARKEVNGRACLDGDVCDHQPGVMRREVGVEGVGKDTESVVQEKEEQDTDYRRNRELDNSAHLKSKSVPIESKWAVDAYISASHHDL